MEIYFRDQKARLPYRLADLKPLPLSYDNARRFPERALSFRVPVAHPLRSLLNCDLDFLFRYEIFPPSILHFFGEWQLEGRMMRTGDIIVQQARIPPILTGFKFLFGVRVLEVYRSAVRAGFRYGTLAGHPETGENEFYFSIIENRLLATVRTAAKPSLFLSRLLAPVFTNPYAAFCNKKALKSMKEKFLKYNPAISMKRERYERRLKRERPGDRRWMI